MLAAGLAMLSVTVSALPRILLAAGALPDAARPFVWSDVLSTYVERLHGDRLPYFETFFEYPPVIGYIAGALVRSTSGPVAYLALWSVISAVTAGVVALLLARAAGPRRAIVFWSLSPQLILYGAANFDALAVGALVGGVVLLRAGRSRAGIGILAVGSLIKVFPAVGIPLELERIRRSSGARAAIGAGAVAALIVAAIAAPSLVAPHPVTESLMFTAGLANFDSVWGLVAAGLRRIGVSTAQDVVAVLSTVGMVGTYLSVMVRRRSEDAARSTVLGLLAVLLWTRLYSPQYSLWIVPLFALVALPARIFVVLAAADALVFATVYPLTLVQWPAGDLVATGLLGALWTGVILRHAALIWIWRDLSRRDTRPERARMRVTPA